MAAATTISKLRDLNSHFEGRKNRARERLKNDWGEGWYFGIIGLLLPLSSYAFDEVATLEEVEEAPGEIELAHALKRSDLFGTIGRYSRDIHYQLKVLAREEDSQFAFSIAWWILSLLRVRTMADFLVPVALNYSWPTVAGLEARTCEAYFVEDFPHSKTLTDPTKVSIADLKWVESHLIGFVQLLENPNFRLAVDSLTTVQHQVSDRMMVATLWTGIEALFNIRSELSFRLATYIATALSSPGPNRMSKFKEAKKLYDFRSKVIHGEKITKEPMRKHVIQVRSILSSILCKYIEAGELFSEEKLEKELFGC